MIPVGLSLPELILRSPEPRSDFSAHLSIMLIIQPVVQAKGKSFLLFAYFLEGNENAAMLRASFMPQTCPSFVDLLMLFTFSAYSSNLVILLKGYRGANGA